MNEIIQNLEANATNGKENFCYISENKLQAIKELSKREQQEKENLIKYLEGLLTGKKTTDMFIVTGVQDLLERIKNNNYE